MKIELKKNEKIIFILFLFNIINLIISLIIIDINNYKYLLLKLELLIEDLIIFLNYNLKSNIANLKKIVIILFKTRKDIEIF